MAPFQIRDDPSIHDDKGPALTTVSVLFTVIAFITTVLRLWVRRGRRALGWDDYIITVAMVLTIIEAALTIQAVTRGKGKRAKFLSKAQIQYINMYSWYAQHVLFATMALIKTSVCLLVVRIKQERKLRIFVGCVITVLVAASIEVSIVLLAQCRPISAHWRGAKPGQCWPTEVRIYSIYVQAGLSILTDLICSLLPIAIMWNVQLPFRKKASIWALMAMGLVCTACSAVRAKSLNSKAKDIAYEYSVVAIWAMAEICLGIIATNLALSRSMYYYFFKHDQNTRPSTHPYPYGSHSHGPYTGHAEQSYTTKIERRDTSIARSEDSDVPLKPIIHKTTEINVQ
ncbi:hypothetical protein CC86DRAFT_320414 [Ophiobolus disseminans]|uniref:Rhodopsin domain-containing protein n=1 Tax=Ophiobolus disseminans TaxID=1469910 RepID=A0A6A7A484_9PLEO|nr:hypothetical protein CC86DRAFT_320414 [Ophiobolus disseminans]